MRTVVTLALAAVLALATWVAGWWALPIVSLAAGIAARRQRNAAELVGLAATLAWATLNAYNASGHRLGAVTSVLGGVFPVPGAALLALTLIFAAAAGWSAAVVGGEIARRVLGEATVI